MSFYAGERRRAIQAAIEATADASGLVYPENIVEAAADPASVLHNEFPWDDRAAAHQHRLDIARTLIRRIEYLAIDEPAETRVVNYVHDPRAPIRRQGYIRVADAKDDARLARELLTVEIDRVQSMVERLAGIAAGLGITLPLDNLAAALGVVRKNVTRPPPRRRVEKGRPEAPRPGA
jgi:hypothetical protein